MKKLCVVNSSGGLDSTTLLARALSEGYVVLPVTYIYGQKNIIENTAQKAVINHYKKRYPETLMDTVTIDFTQAIGASIDTFKKNRDNGETKEKTKMEYYMPSRNLLFLATSAVIGEILSLDEDYSELYLGLGIHKHSEIYKRDYWDISPSFAEKFQQLVTLNDNVKVQVYSPYADKYKSEIVKDSVELGVPIHLTWTCYNPVSTDDKTFRPCLTCEACLERSTQAFEYDHQVEAFINNYSVTLE